MEESMSSIMGTGKTASKANPEAVAAAKRQKKSHKTIIDPAQRHVITGFITIAGNGPYSKLESISRVFNTAELCEMILSYLSVHSLLLGGGVACRGFLTTIRTSPLLQRRLFRRPVGLEESQLLQPFPFEVYGVCLEDDRKYGDSDDGYDDESESDENDAYEPRDEVDEIDDEDAEDDEDEGSMDDEDDEEDEEDVEYADSVGSGSASRCSDNASEDFDIAVVEVHIDVPKLLAVAVPKWNTSHNRLQPS